MVSTIAIASWRERLLGVVRHLAFVGPTLARLTVGLIFVGTGWGKIHDLPRVVDFFTDLHVPLPGFNARLVACTELLGGAAMLLGLGTRLFAVPLSVTMVVAILTAKRPEIEGLTSLLGFEEWHYLVLFLWLAVSGPGPLSLDHLVARRLTRNRNPKPDTHTGE
jgi:putative oxidoreductase